MYLLQSLLLCPIQYILRDILQFDKTLADATSRFTNAHRTCDLILGVGDGKVGAILLLKTAWLTSSWTIPSFPGAVHAVLLVKTG